MIQTTVKRDFKTRRNETILAKGETVNIVAKDGNMVTVNKLGDPKRKDILVPESYLNL